MSGYFYLIQNDPLHELISIVNPQRLTASGIIISSDYPNDSGIMVYLLDPLRIETFSDFSSIYHLPNITHLYVKMGDVSLEDRLEMINLDSLSKDNQSAFALRRLINGVDLTGATKVELLLTDDTEEISSDQIFSLVQGICTNQDIHRRIIETIQYNQITQLKIDPTDCPNHILDLKQQIESIVDMLDHGETPIIPIASIVKSFNKIVSKEQQIDFRPSQDSYSAVITLNEQPDHLLPINLPRGETIHLPLRNINLPILPRDILLLLLSFTDSKDGKYDELRNAIIKALN